MMRLKVLSISWAVLVLSAPALAQQSTTRQATTQPEWPQFRGPDRNGMSKETGLLKEWPAGGPKLLWTAKGCGQGFSSVSIKDSLIYTAGTFHEGTFVVAFDLNGQHKWKTLNAPDKWETPPDKKDWADFFYKGSRATARAVRT